MTLASRIFNVLPPDLAFKLATRLARRIHRGSLKPRDQQLLCRFERFKFGARKHLVAYRVGQGPLVILGHGWAGRATQMMPMALTLAEAGFECVTFDASAHGESGGQHTGFDSLRADLLALHQHLEQRPIHALVAHSASGLAAMSARHLNGLRANAYVCIAAPLFPYPPVDTLRSVLGLSPEVIARCKTYYAAQFGQSWECLKQGWVYRPTESGAPLLLMYDRSDDRVQFSDAASIADLWPGAEVFASDQLGHQKLLWSEAGMARVATFISAGRGC